MDPELFESKENVKLVIIFILYLIWGGSSHIYPIIVLLLAYFTTTKEKAPDQPTTTGGTSSTPVNTGTETGTETGTGQEQVPVKKVDQGLVNVIIYIGIVIFLLCLVGFVMSTDLKFKVLYVVLYFVPWIIFLIIQAHNNSVDGKPPVGIESWIVIIGIVLLPCLYLLKYVKEWWYIGIFLAYVGLNILYVWRLDAGNSARGLASAIVSVAFVNLAAGGFFIIGIGFYTYLFAGSLLFGGLVSLLGLGLIGGSIWLSIVNYQLPMELDLIKDGTGIFIQYTSVDLTQTVYPLWRQGYKRSDGELEYDHFILKNNTNGYILKKSSTEYLNGPYCPTGTTEEPSEIGLAITNYYTIGKNWAPYSEKDANGAVIKNVMLSTTVDGTEILNQIYQAPIGDSFYYKIIDDNKVDLYLINQVSSLTGCYQLINKSTLIDGDTILVPNHGTQTWIVKRVDPPPVQQPSGSTVELSRDSKSMPTEVAYSLLIATFLRFLYVMITDSVPLVPFIKISSAWIFAFVSLISEYFIISDNDLKQPFYIADSVVTVLSGISVISALVF